MDVNEFIPKAKELVYEYAKKHLDVTDNVDFSLEDDVYVVWSTKVLHHAKALLSTTLPDGMYYEITYNGVKGEIYFDAYKKFENFKVEGV